MKWRKKTKTISVVGSTVSYMLSYTLSYIYNIYYNIIIILVLPTEVRYAVHGFRI